MEELVYKVLWVDDEPQNVDGLRLNASKRNIQSLSYNNWEEAFEVLQHEWPEITAIILDANCRLYKSDTGPNQNFLSKVFAQLNQFFGNIHRYIPWYVLSQGTMDNYSIIMDYVRESHNSKEWGKSDFKKEEILAKDNELFDNICSLGKKQSNNIVLYRHREVFKYMGAESLISNDARKIMLKALAVLYYPDENINYEFAGNPIRKVVEYMLKAALKNGLLTNDFLDKKGFVIIWDSMQYLCGMEPTNVPFRFGKRGSKKDYSDNESVLPTTCYNTFRGLLNYVNVDSHTLGEEDDSPYKIDAASKDLFFGYVLFLCHIITCFGKYVEQHPNIEENKAKRVPIPDRKPSNELQAAKPAVEFVKNETADSFIGKVFPAINMGGCFTLGSCKVSKEIELQLLQKARIEEVTVNTDADSKKYPFIVTRITYLE